MANKRKAKKRNPGVRMRKAPKGWIKAKRIKIVRRNGRKVLLVQR